MTLTDMLSRLRTQLRLTPLISDDYLLDALRQAIQRFSISAQTLEKWIIIPIRAGSNQYWLPANHQVTVAAYCDEVRLQKCTAFDAELVSPTGPVYYFEDEWSDDASTYLSTSFLTQYALLSDMILQWLARAQNPKGRKTITLVGVPTVDGDYNHGGAPPVGIVWGGTYDPTVVWGSSVGIPVAAYTSNGNLLVVYKYRDTVPVEVTDNIEWHDGVSTAYMCGALSLALASEADEYDRYRSWLYRQISDTVAQSMRGLAINRRLR